MAYKRERKPYKPEEAFDGKETQEERQPERERSSRTTEPDQAESYREPYKGKGRSSGRGKKESDGKFVRVTRLFPSKGGNSYTVFLNETVTNSLLNFLEESKDSDLLGITLKDDGSCNLWFMKGDK